jgi:hypothetical protein
MVNEEHLAQLKQGVEAWNRWREDNPELRPDLTGALLTGVDLGIADLSRADLREANLSRAILIKADLNETNLTGADLREATNLGAANFIGTNLTGADLTGAAIGGTIFADVDLSTALRFETVQHKSPSTRPKPNARVTSRQLVCPIRIYRREHAIAHLDALQPANHRATPTMIHH